MPRRNYNASGYSKETRKRTVSRWSDEKIAEINRELAYERGEKPNAKRRYKHKKKNRRF